MGTWPLIGIAIAAVLIVFLAVFIWKIKRDGWQRTIDYKTYFIMGVTWLPIGLTMALIFENSVGMVFAAIGAVCLAIGLKNRGKWGKPQKITASQSKIMVTLITVAGLIAALGAIILFLLSTK